MISQHSFARAGLLGNPSDGYGGKTISLTVGQFRATVELQPASHLVIVPAPHDQDQFNSLTELAESIERRGYYGGVRLIKATLKRFHDFCRDRYSLHRENFSISYQTDIPRGVGLAGSSAIVTAALKALVAFYELNIDGSTLASLALSVEKDLLGIPAGLQDRVIQILEGVVYMDFDPALMTGPDNLQSGRYEHLPSQPPALLYVAFSRAAAQPTEVFHNNLQERFHSGDSQVVESMQRFAQLALAGREAWLSGDAAELARLINANFDLRSDLCRLPESQIQMVEAARDTGASAKFCGSGGAIIGTCQDADSFSRLVERLNEQDCQVIQPQVI